jgi:hypothetical protein
MGFKVAIVDKAIALNTNSGTEQAANITTRRVDLF